MRILFVSDTYYPHLNGVYYFVRRIAPLLKRNGHEVIVIAPSQNLNFTKNKIDEIDVYGIPSMPALYYPNIRIPFPVMLRRKVRDLLREINPDIIHVQDHFLIAGVVVKLANQLNIPVIGTNHFMAENLTSLFRLKAWNQALEKMMWSIFSKVYDQLSVVTAPSETAASLIRHRLGVDVVAVSSGIDLSEFSPDDDRYYSIREKYSIPDKPILLYLGRIDPEKHIEDIIEGTALALKENDFCLVIVGKGIRKTNLEKLAFYLGITDRVIFTGFVPDEELPCFYRISQCFIIASTAELLSLSALQAMASALPIIAASAGALVELVHEGVNGFLFRPGDTVGIAQSINKVIGQPQLRAQMSQKSLEYVQKHDIHNIVSQFEKIYLNNKLKTMETGPKRPKREKADWVVNNLKTA